MAATTTKLGFVGLGHMGGNMAALALDAGRELHVPLPSAAAADSVLTIARALGYERRDLAAIFQVLEHLSSNAT
jgi:3-hydroxyisobutyrate dehydrogenase-like beta-hydroxyacid dehydrogenase